MSLLLGTNSTLKRSNASPVQAEFFTKSDRESHSNMKHAEKINLQVY